MSQARERSERLLAHSEALVAALRDEDLEQAEQLARERQAMLEALAAVWPKTPDAALQQRLARIRALDGELEPLARAALERVQAELAELRRMRTAASALRARGPREPQFVSRRA